MAIVFHCEHCNKKIEAADSAGGKRGKCPACHNKVYVPSPESDEELKLAPLDTAFREKEKQLMAETYKLTQDILREREIPDGPREASGAVYELSDRELEKNVILYLRQMAQGDLDEAETTGALIAPCGSRVTDILDKIALSEIPEPELADLPQQLLAGAIRALRARVG
jgi:phage FluMu protein Com